MKLAKLDEYGADLTLGFAIGFLLGLEGGDTERMAGDMVAGMLLLGDVRDAGKQGIYLINGEHRILDCQFKISPPPPGIRGLWGSCTCLRRAVVLNRYGR